MNYDIRLPGYGGAGVLLRRTISGDPLSRTAFDLWLLGPDFCQAVLRRPIGVNLFPDLGRFLFSVAATSAPERDVPSLSDTSATLSVDVTSSDDERIGLFVSIVDDLEASVLEHLEMDFETSRAALVHTAQSIAELVGGLDLADFEGRL